MSAPEEDPVRFSGMKQSQHDRIMARMMQHRAENPSPPREPYIPMSKERSDKILARWRVPGRSLAELSEQYDHEDAACLENTGGILFWDDANEPLPSGPESSKISGCVEEPESEPESDEETRALRGILFHLDLPEAGVSGVTVAESTAHMKKKVQLMLDFVDARIQEQEELAEEYRKGLEESQRMVAVMKENKEKFMAFIIRDGLN